MCKFVSYGLGPLGGGKCWRQTSEFPLFPLCDNRGNSVAGERDVLPDTFCQGFLLSDRPTSHSLSGSRGDVLNAFGPEEAS